MIYQKENSLTREYFECKRYNNFLFAAHMHRNPELIYVRDGEVCVNTELGSETVPKGEFALIPSNMIHSYETPHFSVVDVAIFSEEIIPYAASRMRGRLPDKTRFFAREPVKGFVEQTLFTPNGIPDYFLRKGALYALIGEFLSSVTLTEKTLRNDSLINGIIEYVDKNFRECISLESMSEALGYEPHYLSRYFHSKIPLHFSKYVNLYRVDMATYLLLHTDLPITEIALQSGFQSIRSFNRVYLELTGKTPGDVAKKESEPPCYLVHEGSFSAEA